VMSEKLNLDITAIDAAVASAAGPVEISSQCGVFAESEVISHVNNGESVGAVIAGVCSSVARMAAAQGRKSNMNGRFTITGGVAKLETVTRIVQEKLGAQLCPFPADPQLAAAIGAALLGDPEPNA
jgi:activator of 2-hydroxyglutaryl-CoA dehydratase